MKSRPAEEAAISQSLIRDGVPGISQHTSGAHYFDWHHTESDTLDKVDPAEFRKNIAALAVMGYAIGGYARPPHGCSGGPARRSIVLRAAVCGAFLRNPGTASDTEST